MSVIHGKRKMYDVAIVGGGHNGLTAACYLAEKGVKVVVLEALDKVGGMASSGYLIPEAPQHLINPCALDMMSVRVHPIVPQEQQLERHGFEQIEVPNAYVYVHPDGESLVFGRTAEATANEIRRYSANDAAEFLKLMPLVNAFIDMAIPMMRVDPARTNWGAKWKAIKALLKNRHLKPEIMALISSPAYVSIVERFEHPITRSALCCLLGAAGPIENEGTGIYFALLGFLHRFGIGRAKGGTQAFSNALASRLQELGGEIMLSAKTAEITATAQGVTGVRLENGKHISAKAVVATVHPKVAMELITPGQIDRKYVVRATHAPANAHGGSPMKIDLALSGQVKASKAEAKRKDGLSLRKSVLLVGTEEAVLDNFRCAARGEVSKLPYQWIATPTAVDPSQAPAGQDVVYLYPIAVPVNPREGWDAIQADVTQMMVDQAAQYLDGLKTLEIGRRSETAPGFALRLNVPNGCVVHIDTTTTRSSVMRPAAGMAGELPLRGFYLGGAGTHPGGGVNGLPGKIAAERVKRFLKI